MPVPSPTRGAPIIGKAPQDACHLLTPAPRPLFPQIRFAAVFLQQSDAIADDVLTVAIPLRHDQTAAVEIPIAASTVCGAGAGGAPDCDCATTTTAAASAARV